MNADSFYIRLRGEITGPYGAADLEKMLQRGTASRIHEFSTDRVHWQPLSAWTTAPAPQGPSAPHSPAAPSKAGAAPPTRRGLSKSEYEEFYAPPVTYSVNDPKAHPGGLAPNETSTADYYFLHDARTFGPKPLAVLRSLASLGQLDATDMVWQAGQASSLPAGQVVALAGAFAGLRAARRSPRRTNQQVEFLAAGFCAAFLFLCCANLPHTRVGEDLAWWWSLTGQTGGVTLAIVSLYMTLAGLALAICTPLVRGPARGIVFLSISGAGILLLLLEATWVFEYPALAAWSMMATVTVGGLLSLRGAQRAVRTSPVFAQVQLPIAILLLFLVLAQLVTGLIDLVWRPADQPLPGWGIFAIILAGVATAAGLAAGILAAIAARRELTKGLGLAQTIVAVGYLAVVAGAVSVAAFGAGGAGGAAAAADGRWLALQWIRLLVGLYAAIALGGVGLIQWRTPLAATTSRFTSPGCFEPEVIS